MCHSSLPRFLLPSLVLVGLLSSCIDAFVIHPSAKSPVRVGNTSDRRNLSAPLEMSNFFDDVGKFFDNLSGNNNENNGDGSSSSEVGEQYLGNTRVLTIPVESLKVGGLRLYLSLYLMGQQNTPDKGSWQAHQSGDSGIDVYYRDQTGALMIELDEDENMIMVDRLGNQPSNSYIMQESVIIQGLLDELDTISGDEDIPLENRLLILKEPGDAIVVARESLAFS